VAKVCQKYSSQLFDCLGKQCLKHLELAYAETAFQMCRNVGMVYTIKEIKHETEKLILMGHVASILFKHDLAEESFLKSSKPELALEMRIDLQDWFKAYKLAK
jgi:WD repeat-containing protein 19